MRGHRKPRFFARLTAKRWVNRIIAVFNFYVLGPANAFQIKRFSIVNLQAKTAEANLTMYVSKMPEGKIVNYVEM